jgi:hypothetical protein
VGAEVEEMPGRIKSGQMTFAGLCFLSDDMLFIWALPEVTFCSSSYLMFLGFRTR